MPPDHRPKPRCFVAIPTISLNDAVRERVLLTLANSGFDAVVGGASGEASVIGELATADCVIAELSYVAPSVLFEVGVARAMAKPLIVLIKTDVDAPLSLEISGQLVIRYDPRRSGLKLLSQELVRTLNRIRRSPRRALLTPGVRAAAPFFVNLEQLTREDQENLCRELLTQMGFRRVDWEQEIPELDLIAELPKQDPDGFQYRELWLVSMGRMAPPRYLAEMASGDPEYFLHRISRHSERLDRYMSRERDHAVTLLIILLDAKGEQQRLFEVRSPKRRFSGGIRTRVWDRTYLTSLVQQFPQIGYKYFSDEARSISKYRKSPEELNQENVELAERLTRTVAALEEEKGLRVSAERDAVWKDISFTAAHNIGNPLFAIETNLDPLQKRIGEERTAEALEVLNDIRASVDKAKENVEQFKSLARAQQINAVPTDLCPLLEEALTVAKNNSVECSLDCRNVRILADPPRISECVAELVTNSLHWMTGPVRKLAITAEIATAIPPDLSDAASYVRVDVVDSGTGVPVSNKARIFDAFFTTRDHGTGLGLALVKRIVDGHDGAIFETGVPGEGAHFEVYLPISEAASKGKPKSKRNAAGVSKDKPKRKRMAAEVASEDDPKRKQEATRPKKR